MHKIIGSLTPATAGVPQTETLPESETPEVDAVRIDDLGRTIIWTGVAENKLLDLARSLERRLSLAQTETKGHMRVKDELKAELERAYQTLELNGVPRERAKSVANGIDVLASRFDKQNHFYEQALARENEAQARIAELEKALKIIERWSEFPATGDFHEGGTPVSYGAAYGSNGERDYMRSVASEALKDRA